MHDETGPRRRPLLAGLAGATLLPRLARGAAPDLSKVVLRAGVYRGQDETMLAGTDLLDTPYKIRFAEFSAGNLITQAMNAGALDIGSWSEIPLVFAAAARAGISVVAIVQGPTTGQAVMVPKGSSARSIADLKGKRVGYIRATTAHYFLIKMLAQHGLRLTDIQPVALSLSGGLTAFTSGALDAWATYGYVIPMIEAELGARVLQNAVGILSGNYLVGANPSRLGDTAVRAAIVDYLGRVAKSYAILEADKVRWAKLVSPAVSVPEPIVLAYLEDENQPWRLRPIRPADIASAQDVADVFSAQGLLPGHVDVAPYFSDLLTPLLKS